MWVLHRNCDVHTAEQQVPQKHHISEQCMAHSRWSIDRGQLMNQPHSLITLIWEQGTFQTISFSALLE